MEAMPRLPAVSSQSLIVDDDERQRSVLVAMLSGCNFDTQVAADGLEALVIVFGSSKTLVAKDFWEAWKKRMGEGYPPLKNGLVWAVEPAKKADGVAIAREREHMKTGFEPIVPRKEEGIGKLDDREAPEE